MQNAKLWYSLRNDLKYIGFADTIILHFTFCILYCRQTRLWAGLFTVPFFHILCYNEPKTESG